MGEAEGFQGDAANAFGHRVRSISGALSDVPIVASRIAKIFRSHSHDLTALRKEAGAALARAETRWNDKRRAESDISSHESRLRSIRRQLSALPGDEDPGAAIARERLQSRRSSVRFELDRAQRQRDAANDQLDDSRSEWERLHKEEETLNDQTSKSLVDLELLSLADPSLVGGVLENVGEFFIDIVEGVQAIWESISVELLQMLHDILSDIMDVLDWAGLVLDFIPGVNAIYKAVEMSVFAVRALIGIALVLKGAMSFTAWQMDTALGALGLIPGVPKALIKPLANKASKLAGPAMRKIADGVQDVGRKLNIGTDVVTDVARGAKDVSTRASRNIVRTGENLGKTVTGFFESQAHKSYTRRLRLRYRPGDQMQLPMFHSGPQAAKDRILAMGHNIGSIPTSMWKTIEYSGKVAGAFNLNDRVFDPVLEVADRVEGPLVPPLLPFVVPTLRPLVPFGVPVLVPTGL